MPITRDANYWDHLRDERKHEPRPGERGFSPPAQNEPPARLTAPLSTAMDIALCVRGMKNLQDAARLIDLYASGKAAEAELDAITESYNRFDRIITSTTERTDA